MDATKFLNDSEMWSKGEEFFEVIYRDEGASIAIVSSLLNEEMKDEEKEDYKVSVKVINNKFLASDYKLLDKEEVPKDLFTLNNSQKTKLVMGVFEQLDFELNYEDSVD